MAGTSFSTGTSQEDARKFPGDKLRLSGLDSATFRLSESNTRNIALPLALLVGCQLTNKVAWPSRRLKIQRYSWGTLNWFVPLPEATASCANPIRPDFVTGAKNSPRRSNSARDDFGDVKGASGT